MEWSFPRHPLPARALWKQQGSVCRRYCAPTPAKTRQGSKNKCLARKHKTARGRKLQEAKTAAGRNSSGAAELARPVAGSALSVFNVLDRKAASEGSLSAAAKSARALKSAVELRCRIVAVTIVAPCRRASSSITTRKATRWSAGKTARASKDLNQPAP